MPTALAVIGAVFQVAGARKQAKAQKRSLEEQKKQQALQTRRSRRQAIREMQIRRAAAVAGSVGAGTAGSSGAQGGIGSLGSQLGESFGFSTQMTGLSNNINAAEKSAISGQFMQGVGQLAFSTGMQAGAFSGGTK